MDLIEDNASFNNERKASGACSSCHRRKLKCDRLTICSNCKKANIPCVYTSHPIKSGSTATTRDGRKKVRGPYQKGRTVREKELEHVVELLQEKCTILEAKVSHSDGTSPESSHGSARHSYHRAGSTPATTTTDDFNQPIITFTSPLSNNHNGTIKEPAHPSTTQILELWIIFTNSVDPVTKIIHCPTFTPTLLSTLKCHPTMKGLTIETECLLLAIYITSLNVLDAEECLRRFHKPKELLMLHYSSILENHLHKSSSGSDTLTFMSLQSLVLYLSCLRRQKGPGENIAGLFTLAVRSARNLHIDDVSSYIDLPPLDAELRRRLWWTLCRQESGYAEEIHTRRSSIMHNCQVPLPGNFDDQDLDASMACDEMPAARVGVTDMSFVLMMLEVIRTVGMISKLFVDEGVRVGGGINTDNHTHTGGDSGGLRMDALKEQSRQLLEEAKTRMNVRTLQYCSVSRPFDWFLMIATKMLLTKIEVILLNYSPTSPLTTINTFHDIKVSLSLDIIECHAILLTEPRLTPWRWNYRNTQQWYAMIYVLEEMARRPDAAWVERAWRIVDVGFADMELLNKHGMGARERQRLLEGHAAAIEARERVLGLNLSLGGSGIGGGGGGDNDGNDVAGHDCGVDHCADHGASGEIPEYSVPARSEPWEMDQSLFDVQEAQLAAMEDAFFWPSS